MKSRPDPEVPSSLRSQQEAMTAYLRDPERNPPPPGLEGRGGAVYRELIYNNLAGFLANNFPVLRKTLGEEAWDRLVADFLAEHRARTPYFLEIGQELLDYLAEERGSRPGDLPFLWELAHYEWVELAVSVAREEIPTEDVDPEGDPLRGRPVLSPLAWLLRYRFPVHRIGPDLQPSEAPEEPTCLVVYRDRSDAVGFLEVNPVTARLLQLLGEGEETSGEALLRRIAGEIGHPDPGQVLAGGGEVLRDLQARDILSGTRPYGPGRDEAASAAG